MATQASKRAAKELGNFTHFEHVNFRVPDHYQATLFFVEGLGLTRDPMRMVSISNMWVNVGKQQFHLPLGKATPFAGEVGVTVPDLAQAQRSLKNIAPQLKQTEFSVRKTGTTLIVKSPWGHTFRLHAAGELSGALPQAIPYVKFLVPVGSAAGIAEFYQTVLGVPAQTTKKAGLATTAVNVGVDQQFHFVEQRNLKLPKHNNHVAVYLTHYQAVYDELTRRNLIMEADMDEQFRFTQMVDPQSGKKLFSFEHEMRSLYHPDFLKPLVNRINVPYLVD